MSTDQTTNTRDETRDGSAGPDPTEVVVIDQRTGAELRRWPVAGAAEVRRTVAAARAAAGPWWDLGVDGRLSRLDAWRREIARTADEGAELIHAENGKPLDEARIEVLAVLGHLQYVAANVERVLGRRDVPAPPSTPNQEQWVEYLPYGVVAVIGPWNFPLNTPGAIVIHAMAAGNAVVLKPCQITPGVGRWFVDTWRRAVPDAADVLQCLVGYAETGQQLIQAGVDKVAFTGSVRSGRAVAAQCATSLTPALLELGGKDGVIVAEDADLADAARHIAWGALQNSGLGCISLEVAYVVESVHDAFLDELLAVARDVRAGADDDAVLGPVPLPAQLPIIREHIDDAVSRGAVVALGGADAVVDGRYVQPTILDRVPRDARAATEETFGPTLAIVPVRDADEAVEIINSGPYGLGSAVFSRGRGVELARRIRAGMTSVNDVLVFSQNPGLPFGGRGASGNGRKHGEEGLREFAFPHTVTSKTSPVDHPTTAFGRPREAVAGALASVREQILRANS